MRRARWKWKPGGQPANLFALRTHFLWLRPSASSGAPPRAPTVLPPPLRLYPSSCRRVSNPKKRKCVKSDSGRAKDANAS